MDNQISGTHSNQAFTRIAFYRHFGVAKGFHETRVMNSSESWQLALLSLSQSLLNSFQNLRSVHCCNLQAQYSPVPLQALRSYILWVIRILRNKRIN